MSYNDDETVIYGQFGDNFRSCVLLCNNNGGFQRKKASFCVSSRLLAFIWNLPTLIIIYLAIHAGFGSEMLTVISD